MLSKSKDGLDMAKTNFKGVYVDNNGQFYYEVSLGLDKITGKRIKAKSRTFENGKKFTTAKEAFTEATKVMNNFFQNNGFSNHNITYSQFMEQDYIPFYESDVQDSTFESRKPMLDILVKRFGKKKLRDITVQDAQNFRTWLLSKKGANYSQTYASLAYGTFKRTLEFAVNLQYLTINVASKVKAISKGKTPVEYWTKDDFEQVITKIYIEDFYDHLIFVMLWVYFNTGVRVNEGCALWWSDINFSKKQMRISHMLKLKTKTNWIRQNYTKTESGNRIISLDDDTIEILKIWKKRQLEMAVTSDFIFSYDGAPMMKSTIGRNIKKYAKEAGVPEIQVKGLRHSHASYLINELNVNILIISKRLGHSSPDITLKHYAHMWAGADQEIALDMTGRIAIKTAQQKFFYFNGNQAIKGTVSKIVSKNKNNH